MKKSTFLIIAVLVVAIGLLFFYKKAKSPDLSSIKSFMDCSMAGFPVMESNPRRCKTPDGRTFAEEIAPGITYKNSSSNLIVVDLPFPGSVTGKEFEVRGKARGVWYFEASFPVKVLDKDGNVLFQGPAQAQSDWMTEDFVPFKISVKVPETYIGPATLILEKDNPSGEAVRDASISFPFTIEY